LGPEGMSTCCGGWPLVEVVVGRCPTGRLAARLDVGVVVVGLR
jgi:hypothetical protein